MLSLPGTERIARRRWRGFTLLEVAIVVLILGLLLGGMLVPLSVQRENRERAETQASLDEIKEALYGFVLVNRRLPCPDTDGDGTEDRSGGTCSQAVGVVPWADLGVKGLDAWAQPFGYRVTIAFADDADGTGCGVPTTAVSFELCSKGDINVDDAAAGGAAVARKVPAIVLSFGKNWAVATSADELENTNGDPLFVYKTYSQESGKEFDDLAVWLSSPVLMNRMIEAKLLP